MPRPLRVAVGWLRASRVGMACGTVAETSISLSRAAISPAAQAAEWQAAAISSRGQAVFSGGAAGWSSVEVWGWGRVAGAAARQVFGYECKMEHHTLEGWALRDPR